MKRLDEMSPAVNSSWPGGYPVSWLVGHLGTEVLQSDLLRPDLNSDELIMSFAWIGYQIEVLRWKCLVEEV